MAKVVVMGKNYTSRLGMIRAAGQAGHQVYVVCTEKLPSSNLDTKSKYVSEWFTAKAPCRKKLIETLENIGAQDDEQIVLIPTDDYTASAIDENINVLKKRFLLPNVNMMQGAVVKLMDKDYQKSLARKAGLLVASGWSIDIKNHNYTLPPDISYPCFPKPQISFLFNKRYMRKCSNEQELRRVLDEIATIQDCPILVEEYINIEKEYGVLGFSDKDRSLIPGLVEKKMIGEGAHKGVTKIGLVMPLDTHKALKDKLHNFLALTQLQGLCDIDLYESSGKIYFNELNLRFGAFGYSILCSGANLPALFIDTLLGKKVEFNSVSVRPRTMCLSEKVNLEDYLSGYYGLRELIRIRNMADHTFIKDKDDMQPYRCYRKEALIEITKTIVKKIIRWHK